MKNFFQFVAADYKLPEERVEKKTLRLLLLCFLCTLSLYIDRVLFDSYSLMFIVMVFLVPQLIAANKEIDQIIPPAKSRFRIVLSGCWVLVFGQIGSFFVYKKIVFFVSILLNCFGLFLWILSRSNRNIDKAIEGP